MNNHFHSARTMRKSKESHVEPLRRIATQILTEKFPQRNSDGNSEALWDQSYHRALEILEEERPATICDGLLAAMIADIVLEQHR